MNNQRVETLILADIYMQLKSSELSTSEFRVTLKKKKTYELFEFFNLLPNTFLNNKQTFRNKKKKNLPQGGATSIETNFINETAHIFKYMSLKTLCKFSREYRNRILGEHTE